MNLTQLRLFRDLAREKSFVRVAQNNHISQPAVSAQIKNLEEELGRELIARAPRNIQLTSEGEMILPDVKEILRLCDGLKIQTSYQQGILEGNIRIATIHSIGMYEIGDFLSSFMKTFPKVSIHLEFQRFNDIYSMLLSEKIDLGLVAFPEKRTRIEAIPFGFDDLVLITHPKHPLAPRKTVKLEMISNLPFIALGEGMPTREATDRLLKTNGIEIDVRMTNDNIYTLKKAVEAGVGVSIVPSRTVEEEIYRGTLTRKKIVGAETRRPLSLLKLKKQKLNTPLNVFIEKLISFGAGKPF